MGQGDLCKTQGYRSQAEGTLDMQSPDQQAMAWEEGGERGQMFSETLDKLGIPEAGV